MHTHAHTHTHTHTHSPTSTQAEAQTRTRTHMHPRTQHAHPPRHPNAHTNPDASLSKVYKYDDSVVMRNEYKHVQGLGTHERTGDMPAENGEAVGAPYLPWTGQQLALGDSSSLASSSAAPTPAALCLVGPETPALCLTPPTPLPPTPAGTAVPQTPAPLTAVQPAEVPELPDARDAADTLQSPISLPDLASAVLPAAPEPVQLPAAPEPVQQPAPVPVESNLTAGRPGAHLDKDHVEWVGRCVGVHAAICKLAFLCACACVDGWVGAKG